MRRENFQPSFSTHPTAGSGWLRRFWTFPQTAVSTVWAKNPARAVVRSGARYHYDYQGREIVVDAQTITSSDASAFHHTVEVEVTFNGKQHFNKSWSVSVPRPFV
jgi:hypothetical protein